LPGERNPQSAAEEFALPPQGENVLDASMMAELIVTIKEIWPQLKKSAGTSRPGRKSTARVVDDCRWREDSEPSNGLFGSVDRGRSWRRGSLLQLGRRLKGSSGPTRRR